jgi:hypothetical protein
VGCRVYWYNPHTGALEFCVAKTLNVAKAAKHPGGRQGWDAQVHNEVEAMKYLAGVPRVVRYRDVVIQKNSSIVIIMEYAPSVSHLPLCAWLLPWQQSYDGTLAYIDIIYVGNSQKSGTVGRQQSRPRVATIS